MRALVKTCFVIVLAMGLSACSEDEAAEMPPPAKLTREAIGYYCNMTVVDHQGPKGQIQLKNRRDPIWFSSARDTIAFTLLPEEPRDIAAIYVTDMAEARSWENPDKRTWIDAKTAVYVLGSSKRGGMGAPEPVPFSTREAAESFSRQHGGRVVAFADIPKDSILGMVEIGDSEGDMKHDEEDKATEQNGTHMNMDQDG